MARLHKPVGHEFHQCLRECNGQCMLCGASLRGDSLLEWFSPVVSHMSNTGEEQPMALSKRAAPSVKTMAPNDAWTDPEFKGEYPHLYSFLFDPAYACGTVRQLGGLVVFVRMGVLTVCVNDNDRNLKAYVNATTWAEMLFMLDAGIGEDSLNWTVRPARNPGQTPPY